MHIRDEKDLLRQRIKERAARVSERNRQAESRSICRRIIENLPETPGAICAYMAMPSEADLHILMEECISREFPLFLPRFTRSHFEFRQMQAFDELTPGRFNLPEPLSSATLLDLKDVSVALIPALAFDRKGNRLGRGNGGFDRWLSDLRKINPLAKIWGIALEHQLTERVATEGHDQPVDAIITARELIICR